MVCVCVCVWGGGGGGGHSGTAYSTTVPVQLVAQDLDVLSGIN